MHFLTRDGQRCKRWYTNHRWHETETLFLGTESLVFIGTTRHYQYRNQAGSQILYFVFFVLELSVLLMKVFAQFQKTFPDPGEKLRQFYFHFKRSWNKNVLAPFRLPSNRHKPKFFSRVPPDQVASVGSWCASLRENSLVKIR